MKLKKVKAEELDHPGGHLRDKANKMKVENLQLNKLWAHLKA